MICGVGLVLVVGGDVLLDGRHAGAVGSLHQVHRLVGSASMSGHCL